MILMNKEMITIIRPFEYPTLRASERRPGHCNSERIVYRMNSVEFDRKYLTTRSKTINETFNCAKQITRCLPYEIIESPVLGSSQCLCNARTNARIRYKFSMNTFIIAKSAGVHENRFTSACDHARSPINP